MPVNDQWNAVFAAPLPFFLAMVAVATVIWAAMLWRYKAVNEKQTELYGLLNEKAELKADAAAKAQNELKETIDSLTKQIEDLKKPGVDLAASVDQLEHTSSTATEQLETLSRANNAVSMALSEVRRRTGPVMNPLLMSERELEEFFKLSRPPSRQGR